MWAVLPLIAAASCGGPRGGGAVTPPGEASTRGRVVAIVNGVEVRADELAMPLAEAAGGAVLRERVLDAAVDAELRRRGLTLSDDDVARESRLLRESMAGAAGTDASQTIDILEQTRRQRGLGERRFAGQLRRAAGLRKLVAEQVEIRPEDVQTAYGLAHGPAARLRVILVQQAERGAAIAATLRELPAESRALRASELARSASLDPSAAAGGLVERASSLDPALPASLRQALGGASSAGDVLGPLAADRGVVVAVVEAWIPGDGVAIEAARRGLEARLRETRERELMAQLAAELVASARVDVLDRSFAWSWQSVSNSGAR